MTTLATAPEVSELSLQNQLQDKGYVIVKEAISQQTVSDLRQFLLERFDPQVLQNNTSGYKKYRAFLSDFFQKYPDLFEKIYCNEKVLSVLRALLGNDFVLMPGSNGMRDYFNTLHTDTTEQELNGCTFTREPDYQFVMAGLYLQNNSVEKGGGMFLVPGSHRFPDPMIQIRRDKDAYDQSGIKKGLDKLFGYKLYNFERRLNEHPDGFDLMTTAGDLILFDARVIHRSSVAHQKGWVPDGSKLAIFSHFMRNNQHVANHINDLKANPKAEYDYLRQGRDISALREVCHRYGFETA